MGRRRRCGSRERAIGGWLGTMMKKNWKEALSCEDGELGDGRKAEGIGQGGCAELIGGDDLLEEAV